jgi:hypothetical protein
LATLKISSLSVSALEKTKGVEGVDDTEAVSWAFPLFSFKISSLSLSAFSYILTGTIVLSVE